MREKINQAWQALTIKKKIAAFTGTVFLIIFLSAFFNIWAAEFSLVDFNGILQESTKSSELAQAFEQEALLFENYMKSAKDQDKALLEEAIRRTEQAVENLSFDYGRIGEERYARTWSIKNSYEVYCGRRDAVLNGGGDTASYIQRLYEVYDMQKYLQNYAGVLVSNTIEEGSERYQKKISTLIIVPIAVILFGIILLSGILELGKLMNSTIISPVLKLVEASSRIAANDFFSEDVEVQNEDELGELVRAFNKMKFATGEYILTLEEKRKTLDLLHEEEMEKLETEKQLEMMKLELLKNQINPHFLFNTLNVIGGMANLEDAQTTEKMIKSLSALFRYNLKTPQVEVPLAQELKVVADYMYLQQMRFGSRISYEVRCLVNEERVLIPTFTFQPLVENAIIHGLSPKEEGGKIRIRIWQRQDRIYITVGDNGVGIPPETLRRMREQPNAQESHIGFGNVCRRVHAMYPGGRMEVYSRVNAGTVIVIEVPQMPGGRIQERKAEGGGI